MKMIKAALCANVALFFSSLALANDAQPTPLHAPVEKIFTVRGFDDNDYVEIVAYGKLPSTCHKIADASATIDHDTKEVLVTVNALRYEQQICLPVEIPYFKVIKLGIMEKGTYNVTAVDNTIKKTALTVVSSVSNGQDDFLYAPVKSIYETATAKIEGSDTQGMTVHIKGKFPLLLHGCMEIKEVKDYYTPEDVIVVLPIAVIKENCTKNNRDFDIQHQINYKLELPTLIHVRSMSGDAVNQVVE